MDTEIPGEDIVKVYSLLEEVRAIESLEYHNKNHLTGTIESRSRLIISKTTEAINLLTKFIIFD